MLNMVKLVKENSERFYLWIRVVPILLLLSTFSATSGVQAATMEERYPDLPLSLLKSAVLAPLDDDVLLVADGASIRRAQLSAILASQDPALRPQLEKNLLFILEQQAVELILINEAKKAGVAVSGNNELSIQGLFEHQTKEVTLSEDEARSFYQANKEIMGGATFEQAADTIRHYLLQDKRQQMVADYIDNLGRTVNLRVNAEWIKTHSALAADNPVDKARRSGKPTLVEFGAKGCIPCDMMQPILDKLRKDYPQKLNVVFVHVGEEQILSSRYGIRSIPVQVFFDAKGIEVFRHTGFFPEPDVVEQLKKLGVKK
jgi:thiol-disulfide isomerase/thioredoxin